MNYNKVFSKQFDQNEHFSPFEFSSAGIKIGVWINSGGLMTISASEPGLQIHMCLKSRLKRWHVQVGHLCPVSAKVFLNYDLVNKTKL